MSDVEKDIVERRKLWVIRKGNYFYRPKAQGYTGYLFDAGVWPEKEACAHNNDDPCGPVKAWPYSAWEAKIIAGTPDELIAEQADTITTLRAEVERLTEAEHRVCDGCGTSMSMTGIKASGALSCCPERKMLTASEWKARAERAEAERDDANATALRVQEHACEVAEEAKAGFAALEEEDNFWDACGYPNNRKVLTVSEQAASIIRERDAAIARAEKAEAALMEAQEAGHYMVRVVDAIRKDPHNIHLSEADRVFLMVKMSSEIEDEDAARARLTKPDEDVSPCFICKVPFVADDMVLPDATEGLGHAACFGSGREGYTMNGEPLGPDDPIPTGSRYGDLFAPISLTEGE